MKVLPTLCGILHCSSSVVDNYWLVITGFRGRVVDFTRLGERERESDMRAIIFNSQI